MNKIFTFFTVMVLSASLNAQQQFEGKIVYNLHASMDEKKNEPDAQLAAFFAPQKIKLTFRKGGQDDPEAIILNLADGKIYSLNSKTKRYTIKYMKENLVAPPVAGKTYLGYKASAFQATDNGISNLLGGMFGNSEITFFSSDSLLFTVPEKYSRNPELVIIYKNHVVLGAEIKLGSLTPGTDNAIMQENLITATAIEINPIAVSPAEFVVPTDYVNQKDEVASDSVTTLMDSSMTTVDTTKATPNKAAVKRTTTKKPVSKKTNANKSSAALRKQ